MRIDEEMHIDEEDTLGEARAETTLLDAVPE